MWVGDKCGIASANDEPDAVTYKLGDCEPCTLCYEPVQCTARVVDPDDYVIDEFIKDGRETFVKVRKRT